jgi:hypothetical protein
MVSALRQVISAEVGMIEQLLPIWIERLCWPGRLPTRIEQLGRTGFSARSLMKVDLAGQGEIPPFSLLHIATDMVNLHLADSL